MGKISIGELFGVFLLGLIGLALTPTIVDEAQALVNDANVTGAMQAVVENIGLIWIMVIVGIWIAVIAKQYRGI